MKNIVTLTTIPTRLNPDTHFGARDDGIRSCIDSLLNQTNDNYEIHFNIPHKNIRTDTDYIIPDWLTELEGDVLKIYRTDDLGAITKSLPTIQRITEPETTIIVCDDDLVYHEDMVSENVNNQLKFPGCAVGYDGIGAKNPKYDDVRNHYVNSLREDTEVKLLQHYKTVSYKRKWFEDDLVKDLWGLDTSWNDDVIISAYMAKQGIKKMVTWHDSYPVTNSVEEWQEKGGVENFPIVRHTAHDQAEGCNLSRQNEEEEHPPFLRQFIDA
jgi:hypothetical protein